MKKLLTLKQRKKDFCNNQAGFTFMEMVFIVLLLSTLVTMAILNYGDLQQQTTEELVLIDFKIIRTAARAFYLDHNNFPVTLAELSTNGYLTESPIDKFDLNGLGAYQFSSIGNSCTLRSVGPDGIIDTADDPILNFGP